MKAWRFTSSSLLALLLFSGGCIFTKERFSGDYGTRSLDTTQPSEMQAFCPTGLRDTPGPLVLSGRVAIAELGEPGIDESIVKVVANPRWFKASRETVVLASAAFDRPEDPADLLNGQMIEQFRQKAIAAAATQPSSRPLSVTFEITQADIDRAERQYQIQLAHELSAQSAAEIVRLRQAAVAENAGVLMVLTMREEVDPADSSIFSFLNVLILPIFFLPTEYYHGQVVARGWLIEPRSGRVLRSQSTRADQTRLSPIWWQEENRDQLMDQQRLSALFRVADDLVNKP